MIFLISCCNKSINQSTKKKNQITWSVERWKIPTFPLKKIVNGGFELGFSQGVARENPDDVAELMIKLPTCS